MRVYTQAHRSMIAVDNRKWSIRESPPPSLLRSSLKIMGREKLCGRRVELLSNEGVRFFFPLFFIGLYIENRKEKKNNIGLIVTGGLFPSDSRPDFILYSCATHFQIERKKLYNIILCLPSMPAVAAYCMYIPFDSPLFCLTMEKKGKNKVTVPQ